ncbi:MAG: hypothetical protein IBJ15_00195 [Alphaproteobacteria bacterium]|nr:hypothetical protein [Alphaproteobacteria bacterium]
MEIPSPAAVIAALEAAIWRACASQMESDIDFALAAIVAATGELTFERTAECRVAATAFVQFHAAQCAAVGRNPSLVKLAAMIEAGAQFDEGMTLVGALVEQVDKLDKCPSSVGRALLVLRQKPGPARQEILATVARALGAFMPPRTGGEPELETVR